MTELQKIRERATERVNTVMASQDRAELLRRLDRALSALKEIRRVHPLMSNGGKWDELVDHVISELES